MSTKVASINVVFEDDDNQESLLYSGETTLSPSKFAVMNIKQNVIFREEPNPLYPAGGIGIWSVVLLREKNWRAWIKSQSKAKPNHKHNPHMVPDWNQTSWASLVGVLSPLRHSRSPKLNY